MAGQAAEQIIAGVVLSERLAVTMYGAIHRAQFNGQRNLRGLVIETKLLAEAGFRLALTDAKSIAALTRLEHPSIVPTVTVESGGPDVVVVTRGSGRYVSVQDLIASAKASKSQGGKMSLHVAATIGKAVVEALAVAHAHGVVHGAVHPRSVLVDEDGVVRLGDFVVGRSLTTAVAQGADSSLWRGLAGYLSPELVVGEEPTPASDVFAVGAMLFTMLSGEVPPGTLHVSPAVERLVQRALDTDATRRYKSAKDLLENMLEAFEDDRWELAERGELIKAAGLSATDTNIDDATEDLLASLGTNNKLGAVQVAPIRPSMDIRAEAIAGRQGSTNVEPRHRLDALLTDLDEPTSADFDAKSFDSSSARRDPISEIIQMDPRRQEAIVQIKAGSRGLSVLEEVSDDMTPLPAPMRDSDADLRRSPKPTAQQRRSSSRNVVRSQSHDEVAALDALAGLDEPVRRVSTAVEAAENAADRLVDAANRAEAAARVIETGNHRRAEDDTDISPPPARASGNLRRSEPRRVAQPILDEDLPPPMPVNTNVKGVGGYVVAVLALAALGGVGYAIYWNYNKQSETNAKDKAAHDKQEQEDRERDARRSQELRDAQPDPGTLVVTSNPDKAGVWLAIDRTAGKATTMRLSVEHTAEFAIKRDGYDMAEVQITAANWKSDAPGGTERTATAPVKLSKHDASKDPPKKPDPKKPPVPDPTELPLQPTEERKGTGLAGGGRITIETDPTDAEVWLFIGVTAPEARFTSLTAGRDYTVRLIKDGFKPKDIVIKADDWRDGSDTRPIDIAKKKSTLERSADLEPVKAAK